MLFKYTIKHNDNFSNVKDVMKNYFEVSNRLLSKLKVNNLIFLNNNHCFLQTLVKCNDIISFSLDYDEDSSNIIPKDMKLNIVYEDDCLLIINKPYNMPVHPTSYHFDDTLSNGVKFHFNKIGLKSKIRPVNRLDKDTSGLVIFAKNAYVQEFLIKQMLSNKFEKKYLAILEGYLDKKEGIINAPISRKENSIIERCVSPYGDNAVSYYKVLKEKNNLSLAEFKLETGRTHQIRVHSKYIDHPILGDTLYGNKSNLINRQALHSYKIGFIHPISRNFMEFEIDLPKDMKII